MCFTFPPSKCYFEGGKPLYKCRLFTLPEKYVFLLSRQFLFFKWTQSVSKPASEHLSTFGLSFWAHILLLKPGSARYSDIPMFQYRANRPGPLTLKGKRKQPSRLHLGGQRYTARKKPTWSDPSRGSDPCQWCTDQWQSDPRTGSLWSVRTMQVGTLALECCYNGMSEHQDVRIMLSSHRTNFNRRTQMKNCR